MTDDERKVHPAADDDQEADRETDDHDADDDGDDAEPSKPMSARMTLLLGLGAAVASALATRGRLSGAIIAGASLLGLCALWFDSLGGKGIPEPLARRLRRAPRAVGGSLGGVFVGAFGVAVVVPGVFGASMAESKASILAGSVAAERGVHSAYCPAAASTDPWGEPFAITCVNSVVTVTSPGPDGKLGTGDDIHATSVDAVSPAVREAAQAREAALARPEAPPARAAVAPAVSALCAECEQSRVACLRAIEAGQLPEGVDWNRFEHPVEAAKQSCVIAFMTCTNGNGCPRK